MSKLFRSTRTLIALSFLVLRGEIIAAQHPSISRTRVAAQVIGGTAAIPLGFVIGYASPDVFRDTAETARFVRGVAGVIVAPALTVTAIGSGPAPHATVIHAIGGSFFGWAALSVASAVWTRTPLASSRSPWVTTTAFLAASALPAVGAAAAYDRIRF